MIVRKLKEDDPSSEFYETLSLSLNSSYIKILILLLINFSKRSNQNDGLYQSYSQYLYNSITVYRYFILIFYGNVFKNYDFYLKNEAVLARSNPREGWEV